MNKRAERTVVICDTDLDHSLTLEGALRNGDYDVVTINDATELVALAASLRPAVVLVNPDIQGFSEYDVCKQIKKELNIPVVFLMDKNSTHRATLDACQPDYVVTKPVQVGNLLNLVEKHIAIHQS